MITNTRLQELCNTARQCQQHVDKHAATILERDFAELYAIARDHMVPLREQDEHGIGYTKGPHIKLLFGQ